MKIIKQPKVKAINLKVLFHFYKHHKKEMIAFRIWFISRHILDNNGVGWVELDKLSKITRLKPYYIKRVCKNSILARNINKNRLYYSSLKTIYRKHRLKAVDSYLRGEKITKKFIKITGNNNSFKGYICKCYAEMDIDRRHRGKITKGRIGHGRIAEFFGVTRKTVITNLILAKAKFYRNEHHYKHIKLDIADRYGNWLLNNMEKRIRSHYINSDSRGYKISKNPFSYFIRRDARGGYYLTQVMPNIYKFTGVYLTRVRSQRGNRK